MCAGVGRGPSEVSAPGRDLVQLNAQPVDLWDGRDDGLEPGMLVVIVEFILRPGMQSKFEEGLAPMPARRR